MRKTVAALLMLFALPLLADTLTQQGDAALDDNDLRGAINILQKAVAESPQDAQAHYLLGVAYGKLAMRSSVFRQATLAHRTRDEFERAVSLDPDHVKARFCLIQYYTLAPNFMGGSIEKAQDQAREMSKRDPAWSHRGFAFIAGYLKDYHTAATELQAAVAADPSNMPTLFEVGHLAAISGIDLPQGEQALLKYVAHTPKSGEPSLDEAEQWLSKIYEREGRAAEAAQARAKAERVAAR